jgi:hypothetical protein
VPYETALRHSSCVRATTIVGRIGRRAARPLRLYLDVRFDRLESRLETLESRAADHLARVDVMPHNAGRSAPAFDRVVSQVVSAGQFSHPHFDRLRRLLFPEAVNLTSVRLPGATLHRKIWEYVYVLRAAEQHDLLADGRRAIGFGVGREPIPAGLAAHGVSVLATDLQGSEDESGEWTTTDQHLSDLSALSMPDLVPDEVLERLVDVRYVDMNAVPDDLGEFDLVWSCSALEHLGSPRAGIDFVLRTLDLLRPGGVSVHTTELELTPRRSTADYGNIVVYRTADLDELAREARHQGFEIEPNWYVAMETPADRWIAQPPFDDDPVHLKLTIGDSVSTSVGLLVRRPHGDHDM